MTVEMLPGDSLEVLPTLAENSVDSCVCDPPYHLTSIVKRFGNARGFMSKQWDGGDIAFRPDVWREVYRVLKPGAHLLAFGGTRTYHRMACAIEDAGFEIRDCIMWVYGSGFPKSHDVSKGIDRAAGAERDIIAEVRGGGRLAGNPEYRSGDYGSGWNGVKITAPATPAARQWQGWGTALKPACEPIVLARKPLSEGTVAANVLRWGAGAINVDGTRIHSDEAPEGRLRHGGGQNYTPVPDSDPTCRTFGRLRPDITPPSPAGRWPANLIHDGSEEVLAGFPESVNTGGLTPGVGSKDNPSTYQFGDRLGANAGGLGDRGSAARFFYTAKADTDDRLGSKHPTVKPLDLMQYLVRLVTPKGGLVLDPFAGTGTTGEAAFREGMNAVLIEREAEYQADIKRRIAMLLGGPEERAREAIKERMKDKPRDDGPLFA